MRTVLKYSIIRFRPFVETGEFANIGVIVLRVNDGEMRFRLAPRRFPRVKHFFEDAAYKAYEDCNRIMEEELSRLTEFLPYFPNFRGESAFSEIVKIRESSIVFSEARVADFDCDLDEAVERLFSRFVRLESISQTREALLTQSIKKTLRSSGIKGFRSLRLEDDLVPVTFPVAFGHNRVKAIKPLAFSQKAPLAVLDHGAHWRRRFEILLSKHKLDEGAVLIAVEPPQKDDDGALEESYDLAIQEVRTLPFPVVEAGGVGMLPAIVGFACEAVGYDSLFQ